MSVDIARKDAKRIIHSLGESGIPPEHGVNLFNVGNQSLLRMLDTEYFEDHLKDGGATFKLVVGDYGAGKTHFLYCVRDLAWSREYAVSLVQLGRNSCPYDDQLLVYRRIAENLLWRSGDPEIQDDKGLDKFLENHLAEIYNRLGVETPFDGETINVRLRNWLDGILKFRVESHSFLYAVHAFLEATIREDDAKKALLASYLLGEPLTARNTQSFNVNEKMDKKNAFRMLRSLVQLIRELGYAGTVLLFDEGDRMVNFGSRMQTKVACDNLREVIDKCAGEALPGTMFMYAVPPMFVTTIAENYAALAQRIGSGRKVFSAKNPYSPRISLEDLDFPGEEVLVRIGTKLLEVFEAAYEPSPNRDVQLQNIREIAAQCVQNLSDSHRRVFVKTVVELLREQQESSAAIEPADAGRRLLETKNELDNDGEVEDY